MRMQQKTVVQKTAAFVRAGMMQPPKWYAATKQVPPFHRRPSNGVEALKLPWDGLAYEFASRNPHMVEDPSWLGPRGYQPGAPPISYVFAKRQYALMQNGFKKEEAYKRTHVTMRRERVEDVAAVHNMVKKASAMTGARPSFISDNDVYTGLRYWQSMMQETPYVDWDVPAKYGLDVFLRREVLRWDDDKLKFAQSAKDGTAGALTAEVNRLRVSLFPSTKTKDYTLPSDVIRSDNKRSKDSEIVDGSIGSTDDFGETDEAEFDLNKTEDKVEWKSALIGGDWDETVARFEEMVKEASYEMDWSVEDRQHLDGFVMGQCVRASVLNEAFTWIPDPIADALAKIEAMGEKSRGSSSVDEAIEFDVADVDDLDAASDSDLTLESGVSSDSEKDAEEGERWASNAELQEFYGDWLGLARRRTGRRKPMSPAAARAASAAGLQGDTGVEIMSPHAHALKANVKKVLDQAKRQLLPNLVLEVDEHSPAVSAAERMAKHEAQKKIIIADLELETEEVEAQRNALIEKMRKGMSTELTEIEKVREKRLAKGTWKAERRRLKALERELMKEEQSGAYEDEESAKAVRPNFGALVYESEVVKAKGEEFYAKEKARMKREKKLAADAVAAGKELKRKKESQTA